MAEKSEGAGKQRKDVKPDEIIERLVPDPANPRVTKLVGLYLGNSSRHEYWRLYLNASLSRYLEFRKEDTLDSERLSTDEIVVWLKPDAKVEATVTAAVPEEFLRGEFQGRLGQLGRIASAIRPMLALGGQGCGETSSLEAECTVKTNPLFYTECKKKKG